jgi:HD superfamily phosphohydrolase YqeK
MMPVVKPLHPLVTAAATGRLPAWAVAGPKRVEHMARVAELLDSWAQEAGYPDEERERWRAVGYLHDVLRDESPGSLRVLVPWEVDEVPDALLHGPAAAKHLRQEGVADEELLAAVAFHTIGDPSFGRLGRALYAADFLEPGRTFKAEWRAELRVRAAKDLDGVVLEVARARLAHLDDHGLVRRVRTAAFLNQLEAELDE